MSLKHKVMSNGILKAGPIDLDKGVDFVMSDESIDRVGDSIKAAGWIINDGFEGNPIALYGHNHDKPIGVWENVRVQGKKLIGRLKLAAKGTSPEIDTIRSLIEQRILKAVSVGFQPLEYEEIKETGGLRFIKQALHECSLVAVPCNANALSLAKANGLDETQARRLLTEGHVSAPAKGQPAGTKKGTAERPVSRTSPQSSKKDRKPMNIAQRIAAKRERLVSVKDELTELKGLLEDESYELSEEEQESIEMLTDEEASVIKSIESLEKLETGLAAKATPARANFSGRGVAPGAPAKKQKGGSLLSKHIVAGLFAHKHQTTPEAMYHELYGSDDEVLATKNFYSMHKTSVPSGDTATQGWASELVQSDTEAFLEELQPISVYAALRARGRAINFGGMGSIKIPSRASATGATNDMAGAWVGENGVIPVKRAALTSQVLEPSKLAVISVWSNELDRRSMPQIEGLVRQMILDDTAKALDGYLLDNKASVPRVRPAGLLHNVTLTGAGGATATDIITGLKTLFTAMQQARVGANPVIIMNSIRLLGLSTITTAAGGFLFRDELAAGRLLGVPVIAAEHVEPAEVYIVDAGSFAGGNDTPEFRISEEAVLSMANADLVAPTQAQDGSGGIGTTADQVGVNDGIKVGVDLTDAANVGVQYTSLYQQYQTAIRMVLPTGWGMMRTGGVAGLNQVAW